ncbi:HAMP domain-containing histidine kinase [Vibrio sp. S4M6]|uniref:sensor histidine kinase n=1 Tax=Vibrio sinus TaxID=2946865 RepID=UPI002029D1DD|nr:HAMP domain-containing sensor histidine kinase [Vibrio sinus]MCL9780938.1 HAMP domain-containing histidine kinase [Vibrio sinus]
MLQGFKEAQREFLMNEAIHFEKQYEINANASLPHTASITGYLSWQALPEWIQNTVSTPKSEGQPSLQRIRYIDGQVTWVFWPDKTLFLLTYPLKNGKTLYLTSIFYPISITLYSDNRLKNLLLLTFPIGLIVGLIMHFLARSLFYKAMSLLKKLGDWVDSLQPQDVDKPVPNFYFEEINRVARQQQSSFIKITQLIEQEKSFLRHASHELRTPIAILRNNGELLNKLASSEEKYAPSIARVNRAALNMQHITETLLWLSSDDERQIKVETVDIHALIQSLIEDNAYLREGKDIKIKTDISIENLSIEAIPCQLVINNILRNAFQYTQQGSVAIHYSNQSIVIENNDDSESPEPISTSDYGYGLGLRLVERIVSKIGWQYQNELVDGGRKVSVHFYAPTEDASC